MTSQLGRCTEFVDPPSMKKKNSKHDYALDSTLISIGQLEHDCTAEYVMFDDRTLDDMSSHDAEGGVYCGSLCKEKGVPLHNQRSRMFSDESFFGTKNFSSQSFNGQPYVPPLEIFTGKQFSHEQEEYKQTAGTLLIDTKRRDEASMRTPPELLSQKRHATDYLRTETG